MHGGYCWAKGPFVIGWNGLGGCPFPFGTMMRHLITDWFCEQEQPNGRTAGHYSLWPNTLNTQANTHTHICANVVGSKAIVELLRSIPATYTVCKTAVRASISLKRERVCEIAQWVAQQG